MKVLTGRFKMNSDEFTRGSGKWKTIEFNGFFNENEVIVVTAQVQSYRGPDSPGLRIRGIDKNGKGAYSDDRKALLPPTHYGFQLRLNELVGNGDLSNGHHTSEYIGWVAYAYPCTEAEKADQAEVNALAENGFD